MQQAIIVHMKSHKYIIMSLPIVCVRAMFVTETTKNKHVSDVSTLVYKQCSFTMKIALYYVPPTHE